MYDPKGSLESHGPDGTELRESGAGVDPRPTSMRRSVSFAVEGSTSSRPTELTLEPDTEGEDPRKEEGVDHERAEEPSAMSRGADVRKGLADGTHYKRLSQVTVKVICAKKVPNTDRFGKSDPYCLVKGIRSNAQLVDIAMTPVINNNLSPVWNAEYTFSCPRNWGLVELVGLKFLLFDSDDGFPSPFGSDDFLGGADVDISEQTAGIKVPFELELGGVSIFRLKTKAGAHQKIKRPRLQVEVMVQREVILRPPSLGEKLLSSLRTVTRVMQIGGRILKARNLRNAHRRCNSVCVVSVVTITGEVIEIDRSGVVENSSNPDWNFEFRRRFHKQVEPTILIVSVWDVDSRDAAIEDGDHLGSAWLPLAFITKSLERLRLDLYGDSHLITKRGHQSDGQGTRSQEEQSKTPQKGLRSFLNMFRRGESRSQSTITIQVAMVRHEGRMPHADLLDNNKILKDDDDCRAVLDAWADDSMFSPPDMIQNLSVRAPVHLRAKPRIMFLCGVVRGASGLVNKDLLDKSDPYCVVEGLAVSGAREFIHRTRVIQNCLSPAWQEPFYLVAPPNFDVHRLSFKVYDSDEQDLLGGADEFLGGTSIDLSYLENGDCFQEEVPLIGVSQTGGVKSGMHAFRRVATISLQICVERRIAPVLDTSGLRDPEPVSRHTLSRLPPAKRGYVNPSQEPVRGTTRIGALVVELYGTQEWTELAQRPKPRWLLENWRSLPRNRPRKGEDLSSPQGSQGGQGEFEDPGEAAKIESDLAADDNPSSDMYNLSTIPRGPLRPARTKSLPALVSRADLGRPSAIRRHVVHGVDGARAAPNWHHDYELQQAYTVMRVHQRPSKKVMEEFRLS